MQALRKIMVAKELSPVMDIPDCMQNIQVEVIVTPYLEYNYSLREKKASDKSDDDLTPRVKSLLGSFEMPKECSLDYKKEIAEALEEKYLCCGA